MTAAQRGGRTPGQEALELDGDVQAGRRAPGRVEQLVARAIDSGVEAGVVDAQLDAGTAALAVATARAVDRGAHDPYAVAAVCRELAQLLDALRLTPAAREAPGSRAGGTAGGTEAWLRGLAQPT